MNAALRQQIHELRARAAQELVRAERLLEDIKNINEILSSSPQRENNSNHGRRTISRIL